MYTLIDKIWIVIYGIAIIFLILYLISFIHDIYITGRTITAEDYDRLAGVFFAFAIATVAGSLDRDVEINEARKKT